MAYKAHKILCNCMNRRLSHTATKGGMFIFKLSEKIGKVESLVERRLGKLLVRHKGKLWKYVFLGVIGLYFYSMFVNSVKMGIGTTFAASADIAADTVPQNLLEWNPFKNLAALFSPVGFGVTFITVLMAMLVNKKGYHILSGYKFTKDKRGFDILPDGTHGTSGFMTRKEMPAILDLGKPEDISGTILGKLKEHPDDDNKYADYITPKRGNGLNDHILVFGASGAGKSRGFVKPFVLQCAKRKESLILVDPKGEFFENMSEFLRDEGYEVKAFNLLDMNNSDGWNCMADIQTDKSLVQSMAEVIMRNTSNASEKSDFWEKAEQNLFMALIHYVQGLKKPGTDEPLPIEQRSLGTIYKMLSGDSFNTIEQKMNMLPKTHPAKAPYGIFKLANRQIWGNIAIGLGNRLNVFQNELVDKITKHSEIDLEAPGRKPCAYFCIISDQDSALEFLSSLFFSTLFVRLTNYARRQGEGGRLPVKVNVCLDEFCNVGKILDFKKILSTVRSRGINCQIIAQSAAQLSDRYEKKEWEELVGNCDTQLFLGCNDDMTAEFISKKCGMVTISVTNNAMPLMPLFSPVLHSTRPYSQSKSSTQRALMLPDEVLRLPNAQSIVLLRGQKPLLLDKIIPDELPSFNRLRETKVVEYMPEWRLAEKLTKEKAGEAADKIMTAMDTATAVVTTSTKTEAPSKGAADTKPPVSIVPPTKAEERRHPGTIPEEAPAISDKPGLAAPIVVPVTMRSVAPGEILKPK